MNGIYQHSLLTPQTEQLAARELGDDNMVAKPISLRPLDKQLPDHKDVNKALGQLASMVSSLRVDVGDIVEGLSQFSALWNQVHL